MKVTHLLLLLLSVCRTSASTRASLMVTPSWSQYFEYETVTVSCDSTSSGEWTVWRYTAGNQTLMPCGSDGSSQTPSCIMTVKQVDSGVYWCESKHRDSSNTVNITVTSGPVILQSPVLPVKEGDDVTLHCKTKTTSYNLPASFYKDGSRIRTYPTGHMTIHNFSKSDEGAYKCNIHSQESPSSWLLIKVFGDTSQLFEYENLNVSCGDNSSVHEWKVMRNTTPEGGRFSSCGGLWGTLTHFGCILYTAKPLDSAIYWCESPARQRSNSVNITIHDGPVILQSPVLPVMVGDNVTLHCKTKTPTANIKVFYKDGSLIRTEPTGHMTIHHVNKSDEGLYKCNISGHGESPPSWLFVRDRDGKASYTADPTQTTVLNAIRHLVVFSPYCVATVLMLSLYRQRLTGRHPPVSTRTAPLREDGEGLDQPFDGVIADVTTEHHF
ncbi:Fc receptor-like protein 5 isoform X2 [Micropterus salmoides]|uniref:Fc receptor-like protein 5 isoform X2 n=1 Tax=Micropterus salmoides TaxID=27706 RepID=UPI0018EAD4D7|nr:Fc receptor-like protein 5 isoform X2 [Micropterus salmoides]